MNATKRSSDEEEVDGKRGSCRAVPIEAGEGLTATSHHHVHLTQFTSVQDLYQHTISRLKLSKSETSFDIEKGHGSIEDILRKDGNIFEHDAGYRTGKWITHVASFGMNRLRRWQIFDGEVGFSLHTPSNTIYHLLPGQHYLNPLVYSSSKTVRLPTGLEARPFVSYLDRAHVVRVRPGDVVLVTVNGSQEILGEGFHYFEAKNFVFNFKHQLARTNFIRHGNRCRVFVPRGSIFTAVIDQQPVLLPHRPGGYLFDTPRFQIPKEKRVADACFVKIGKQDIEHRSVRIFLVPKGYRVFAKYRGDPLVFEHNPLPYVIDDPLFEWGARDFVSSRLPLSVTYAGLLGLHYIRVPKGQLLLVMINGKVSAIANDPKLKDVPRVFRSPNLTPIAFVSTAQRFVTCATWNRVIVRCGEICLAWHQNKAVRLKSRAEPHVIEDDDCFRLRSVEEERLDSTIESEGGDSRRKFASSSSSGGRRTMSKLPPVDKASNTFLRSDVPSLMSVRPSAGIVIQPGIGFWTLENIDVAFKQLVDNHHHGPFCQKTVPPGFWGICRVNAHVHAFLDRFESTDASDFQMIGVLPAVEQLIELSLNDVRAADHRLNIKVDFIFKIVDATKALRSLIPVDKLSEWRGLLEERAKSVVTSLLPRVESNLTIRNSGSHGPSIRSTRGDDDDGMRTHQRGTFMENFTHEVDSKWGQSYMSKAFTNNGIILVSLTPSELHLTDKQTKLRLEESAREASLQEMKTATIQKGFEARAQKIRTDMELQKMQQRLELMKIENEKKLQEERAALNVQIAEAASKQSKIKADASSYAAEKSKSSGAFTPQQLEVEKLKIIAQCFSGVTYSGPQMMQQQQRLVASLLANMGMGGLVPSMTCETKGLLSKGLDEKRRS